MIPQSKPETKAPPHPLSRFVTKEAVARLLNVDVKRIREIRRWPYVMHVVGDGISTFVSYADMPPIIGVEPPTAKDFLRWRKRWKKNQYLAPEFWVEFYAQKFRHSQSIAELLTWGQLVGVIKFALGQNAIQWLRNLHVQQKLSLEISSFEC